MPTILNSTQSYWNSFVLNNSILNKLGIDANIYTTISNYITQVNSFLSTSIALLFSQLVNITTTLFKIFTGALISIYFLLEKESAIKGIKAMLYAFFNASTTVNIIKFAGKVNIIFKKYIIGKSIDSFIIGIICFVMLSALGIQYPLLISIIIGITNLIPYFGNFIGLVPTFLLTFFFSPVQAAQLTVLVFLLSILDGWLLAPKIIGDKIGLGPVWIIVAIILGGGLFGVIGMFLGVPVIAIIKALIDDIVQRKIKLKNIDIDKIE
jgi:predicted PurR-regulated permease PerM